MLLWLFPGSLGIKAPGSGWGPLCSLGTWGLPKANQLTCVILHQSPNGNSGNSSPTPFSPIELVVVLFDFMGWEH